jgi:hypothetical protein
MIKRALFTTLIALLASTFMVLANAQARTYQVGQTVFVGFPAANIKDDAFIIGLIKKVLPDNRYQIKVMDYVEGHDYGVSCVPMAIDEQGNESESKGWELWDDKKKLTQNGVEYIVSGKNILPLSVGQHKFITRNNVFTTYSRWRSNAPMLSVDRLNIAENEARSVGLGAMVPVFELAKLERQAYYEGNFGRPYWPYEAVSRLPTVLKAVLHELETHPKLDKLWRQKPRDWKTINQDTYTYFMINAMDKIVSDASGTLDEDMEKADPQAIKEVKRLLKQLGVNK